MKVRQIEPNCIIVNTCNGNIHVSERDDKTKITFYDHFNIEISGKSKAIPTVVIDSDEFPTRLKICQTESKWITCQ